MHGRQRRAQEEKFLQGLLEAVAPLLSGEPIAQVCEGDESPLSSTVQTDTTATTATGYCDYYDPCEQPLLLYRPVIRFTRVY